MSTRIRLPSQQAKPLFPEIPEAPTYYPTHEEFKDPIRAEAEKWGICKIVPPAEDEERGIRGFREEVFKYFSSVDPTVFKFKTKVQAIHQLQWRSGPNERFLEELKSVLGLTKDTYYAPYIGNVPVDLYQLFFAVRDYHGTAKMTAQNWQDTAALLHLPKDDHVINDLKKVYEKFLAPYEPHYKKKRKEKKMLSPKCAKCNSDDNKDILVCDRTGCIKGYHLKCINSPLVIVPRGYWLCPQCQTQVEREEEQGFGYPEGNTFNLIKYEKQATDFKETFFAGRKPSVNEIEREYWRIVSGAEENVHVFYGSDVDCTKKHSGFPPPRHKNPFALSGWNVNNLPKVSGSVLRYIPSKVAGVTHPMMYIGMLFSTFCWHNEDNYLYSINYLHTGEPKLWYGIPGAAAEAFENLMRETYPHLFKEHNDLLYHLVTTLTPALLVAHGIPVCRAVQEQGHIMITFPQAYHGGFNTGFNVAESVNFAPSDWLPYGRDAKERYRNNGGRSSVFSHEELVMCAARDPELKSNLAKWLVPEMELILQEEQNYRLTLTTQHGLRAVLEDERRGHDTKLCVICRFDCYLDWVTCDQCAAAGCLRHALNMCSHPVSSRVLHMRISTETILNTLNHCRAIAAQPQEELQSSLVLTELAPKRRLSRSSSLNDSKRSRSDGENDDTQSDALTSSSSAAAPRDRKQKVKLEPVPQPSRLKYPKHPVPGVAAAATAATAATAVAVAAAPIPAPPIATAIKMPAAPPSDTTKRVFAEVVK